MTSIFINKIKIFEIFERHHFTASDEAITEVVRLIEKEIQIKAKEPLSESIKNEIKSKFMALNTAWNRAKTNESKAMFKKDCTRNCYKFNLQNNDLEKGSLVFEYENIKKKCDNLDVEKKALELNVKELNNELNKLKEQLARKEIQFKDQDIIGKIASAIPKSFIEESDMTSETDLRERASSKIKEIIKDEELNNIKRKTINNIFSVEQKKQKIEAKKESFESFGSFTNNQFDLDKSVDVTAMMLKHRLDYEKRAKYETKTIKSYLSNPEMLPRKKCDPKILQMLNSGRKRKYFHDLSKKSKNQIRSQIKEIILDSTDFLRNIGLSLKSVELDPMTISDDPPDDHLQLIFNCPVSVEQEKLRPNVNNLLYCKDKFGISDKAYSQIRSICHLEIPTSTNLIARRQEIDKMFDLHENEMGVFLSLKDKLLFRLKIFFDEKYIGNEFSDDEKFEDNIIHIKLAADGTNIGRNLKLLNFTFTIMNEGNKAKKASGNYTLGIFEIENENHSSIKECFEEIIKEIQFLKEIKYSHRTLKIVYYHGGDWKMLANSVGILCANSKYPCIWCKACKEEFALADKEWSMIDSKKGARSHEEQFAIINHPDSNKIVKYGYHKQPIFKDIIPFNRYMIDMLHLFLRISDSLLNLLIKDCTLADNFDAASISKFDVTRYKHMNSLEHFLNAKCHVKFSFSWMQESKKLTWRDLVGPEKHRMFENMNLAQIIPNHEKLESISQIWKEFYSILNGVKRVELESSEIKHRTCEWLKLYLTVYNKTTVTPYMHAFVAHLHEFVNLYQDINAFNCQGLEKLNDLSTGQYFKGTNRRETALHQMLKKRNRMEYLTRIIGYEIDD